MNAVSTMTFLGAILAVTARAAEPAKDDVKSMPPHIEIAELGPQHNGQEVRMTFTVRTLQRCSSHQQPAAALPIALASRSFGHSDLENRRHSQTVASLLSLVIEFSVLPARLYRVCKLFQRHQLRSYNAS